MSKAKRKNDYRGHTQNSIFDYLTKLQRESSPEITERTYRCIDRLRSSLRQAIKECPLSVAQIAGEISHLTGDTITADVIYSWTRETDSDGGINRRHIPAEYLPAFCSVTGCNEPLIIMGKLSGFFVLPGPEALRAEIAREEARKKRITDSLKRRKAMLAEMEMRSHE
jgi:hypothetical protein